MTIHMKNKNKKQTLKRWKLDNADDWKQYNEEMKKENDKNPPRNYTELAETMLAIMKKKKQ